MFRRTSVFASPTLGRAGAKAVTTVFRFHNEADATSFDPPVLREFGQKDFEERQDTYNTAVAEYKKRLETGAEVNTVGFKHFGELMVEEHAAADRDSYEYRRSPFVSVAKDKNRLAETNEPWAKEITRKATHISTFQIPSDELIAPSNPVSEKEGELLHLGPIGQYRVSTEPNPFRLEAEPKLTKIKSQPELAPVGPAAATDDEF